jgi:hypothetical protein
MKPWVVDAKDIEPEDLDQFSGQLLHLNNQIADFLDPATTEAVLVIAPKGFGKTLLLKAKRQSMRERYRTARPIEPHEVPLLRESDGRFDLAKPGGEAPMLRRLQLLDGAASVG